MSMFDLRSVNDVLGIVTGRGDAVMMLSQDADGAWKPITSNELYGRVRALADGFHGWGLGKGGRGGMVSGNRGEGGVTARAPLAVGGREWGLYRQRTAGRVGDARAD